MSVDRASRVNPVLARELRERMKGRRAAVVISFWLAANTAILWLVYESESANSFDPFNGGQNSSIGRGLFEWVLFTMLLVLFFLVPAQSSGAIAGERERQTLLPLQVTLLSPLQIIVGKILAAVAFVGLLIVAALPLLAIAFLIGGVLVSDIILGLLAVLFVALVLAALCTATSTFAKRVQASTVRCYGLVLLLVLGPFVAMAAYAVVDNSRGSDGADPPSWFLAPNPLAFAASVIGDPAHANVESPLSGLASFIDTTSNNNDRFVRVEGDVVFEDVGVVEEPATTVVVVDDVAVEVGEAVEAPIAGFAPLAPAPEPLLDAGARGLQVQIRRPASERFWLGSGGLLVFLCTVAVGLAVRRLRTPAASER